MGLELLLPRLRILSQKRHSELVLRDEIPPLADPAEVGRMASRIVRQYFALDVEAMAQGYFAVAECAGLLVYGIERYGYTYDDIVNIADERVARLVAALSADTRESGGPRVWHFVSSLGQADALTQLVKLAEVAAITVRVADDLTDRVILRHNRYLRQLTDDSIRVMASLTHLRKSIRLTKVLKDVSAKLQEISVRIDTLLAQNRRVRQNHVELVHTMAG